MTLRIPAVLLALSIGVVPVGCGGSSSETPPPLEPLPVNLHYDRSSTALSGELPVAEGDAGVARANDEPEAGEAVPPARSTWGSERTAPEAPLK